MFSAILSSKTHHTQSSSAKCPPQDGHTIGLEGRMAEPPDNHEVLDSRGLVRDLKGTWPIFFPNMRTTSHISHSCSLPEDKVLWGVGAGSKRSSMLWAAATKSLLPPPFLHQLIRKPWKGRRGERKGRTKKTEILTLLSSCANTVSSSLTPVLWFKRSLSLLCLSTSHSYLPALTRSASGESPVFVLQEGCSSSAWVVTHGCCRLILCCGKVGGAQPGARSCPSPLLPVLRVIWRISDASPLFPTLLSVVLLPLVPAA